MKETKKGNNTQGVEVPRETLEQQLKENTKELNEALKEQDEAMEAAEQSLKKSEELLIPTEKKVDGFIEAMIETNEVKKKERKPNTIYTLKSFKEHINKLATYKVCTAEEITQLRKIHKAATSRWIGLELE